ncbi:MAG: alcohol dehydrogenase catalytic domain-containing protein [Candidatus Binatia bacterium]|nr:alcohol dehydrogenase catalytic domain-containing protein [Candidatus Binatia bacterium]
MKAVRCSGDGVVVTDVPAPSGDGIDVQVRSSGICGSDIHLLGAGLTATLGHEFAGVLSDGTAVAVEPIAPCRECSYCRSGRYNHCVSGASMILGVGLDGGMAERVRVPESSLVPLPASVPVSDACLVEPLAIAVHGIRRVGLGGSPRVAVIGGGTIGLTGVAAARATGAHVDLAARHDAQKAAGARLGAGEVDATEPYDVVIDAAGTTSSLDEAVNLLRPCGKLLILATFWEGMTMPGFGVCMKEIDVIPAAMYSRLGPSRDVDAAAALLASNPEIARSVITHRFPLEAASEAFRIAADRKAGAIKVVLEP